MKHKTKKRVPVVRVQVFLIVLTRGTTRFRMHPRLYLDRDSAEDAVTRIQKLNPGAKVDLIEVFACLPEHIQHPDGCGAWIMHVSMRHRLTPEQKRNQSQAMRDACRGWSAITPDSSDQKAARLAAARRAYVRRQRRKEQTA